MNLDRFNSPRLMFRALDCALWFSSSKSEGAKTTTTTHATDNKKAVGDSGVLAESGAAVDQSRNDNRTFDDHSSFSIVATDARDLSDKSTTTNTDARDFSDRSTFTDKSETNTTVYAADADALKNIAAGSFSAANQVTGAGVAMFDAALAFGDRLVSASIDAQKDAAQQAVNLASGAIATIAESTQDADTKNTETLIKGAQVIAGLAALVLAVRFFRRR